ncbi:MAG: CDP-alcohol phosphatidyltransferase family protein [Thermodesulfobacteriota bacterium]
MSEDQGPSRNVLTVATLLVSAITGLFYHYGWIFAGGVLVLAGSTFDIFDGRVARAQGLSSESGAFFDSCLDRFSEAFIYLGLLSLYRDSIFAYVVFLILVSTTMVSYTRARAEGLGVKCELGIMQRTERVVYLGVLSVFNFLGNIVAGWMGHVPDDYLLKLSLILMLVSSYTALPEDVPRNVGAQKERRPEENRARLGPERRGAALIRRPVLNDMPGPNTGFYQGMV